MLISLTRKIVITIALTICASTASFAFGSITFQSPDIPTQIAKLPEANKLVEWLIKLFNAADSASIRSLATSQFSGGVSEEVFRGMVSQIHSLGTLSQPELMLDLGEQRHYRLNVKRDGQPARRIVMIIGAESGKKYFSLAFERYLEPISRPLPFNTDNIGKSAESKVVKLAVDRYIRQFNPVGISIAILNRGKESYFNYGEVTVGKGHIPTKSSIYEIGSITKTMTGILLAQATVEKKIKLEDDIRLHLPGTFPILEFDGRKIMIRDLATHTSGLPANPPGIPDDGKADAYESYSHSKLLSDLESIKLSRKPGIAFSYSNMGAGLAGLILESAFKTPFESLLQKYIFGPAKMMNTGISLTKQMNALYVTPHDASAKVTERWTVNGIESAGAVRSTAKDMLRYVRFNLDDKNVAASLSHQKLSQPGLFETGIFWVRSQSRLAGTYFTHEGGTGGFSSDIVIMPKKNLAVVVLMNSGDQKPGQISQEIALRIINGSK